MIYLITNLENQKRYVGKTNQGIHKRFYQHCKSAEYNSQTYLHRSIRKYGPTKFNIEVIDEEYSDAAERYHISNLQPEYNMTEGGDGGWINDQTGNTWKVKDTSKMGKAFREGYNHSEQWRKAVVGGNNYQCSYIIYTPWGTFETWSEAVGCAKLLREQGRKDVISDKKTLKKYCECDITLSQEGRRTFPEWRGKSTREIGFKMEMKHGSDQ